MDDLGRAIVTHLRTVPEVTAMVGEDSCARIHPDVMPQEPIYPAIVYYIVTNRSEEHLGGSAGLSHARFRLDCYARTRADANLLAEIVRSFGLPSSTKGDVGGMWIEGVQLEAGPHDEIVSPRDGSQQWIRFTRLDFMIAYRQSVPA